MKIGKQPWLYSPGVDGGFILFPAFATVLAVLIFQDWFASAEVSPLLWLLLVVCVDVAHVYSTLYRTYFDKEEFQRYKRPLIWLPIIGFLAGAAIYWFSPLWFWRLFGPFCSYCHLRRLFPIEPVIC